MYLKVTKRSSSAIMPHRANNSDAGIDVYTPYRVFIQPNSNKLIDTELSIEVPQGYCLMVCNKSSVASKKELIVGAHIIDAGYSGPIMIDMHNLSNENQIFKAGDKIAQLLMVPVIHWEPIEVDAEELYKEINVSSARGEGGFGSTS